MSFATLILSFLFVSEILQLLFNYMFLPEIVNHFVVFIKKNRLKSPLVAFERAGFDCLLKTALL